MLLASLLLGLLAPAAAVFRGRPGLYTRLFDISPLCPHISFAQPAASTATEDSILLLQVALVQWRQCYYYPDLPRPPGWRGQCEAGPGDEAAGQGGDGGHVGEEQGAVQPQVQVRPR